MLKVFRALKTGGQSHQYGSPSTYRNQQIKSEILQSDEYRRRAAHFVDTTETKKLRNSHALRGSISGSQIGAASKNYSYEQTSRENVSREGEAGAQNKKLFQELEAIFQRNKQWMQGQNDREMVIKNLADQY